MCCADGKQDHGRQGCQHEEDESCCQHRVLLRLQKREVFIVVYDRATLAVIRTQSQLFCSGEAFFGLDPADLIPVFCPGTAMSTVMSLLTSIFGALKFQRSCCRDWKSSGHGGRLQPGSKIMRFNRKLL